MFTSQRFFIDQDDYITDTLNPTAKYQWPFAVKPNDEMELREHVLQCRLWELVSDLIINTNPMKRSQNGEDDQSCRDERNSLSRAVWHAIRASRLNTLDIAVSSLQRDASGELMTEKMGMQDFTSLSLFADDVERLLRDLYGDSDIEAIDRIRRAVFAITEEFTQYLCKDLWQEHQDACDVDFVLGIGVPEECSINGNDCRRADKARYDLAVRFRAVYANPTAFSKYTREFAKPDPQWALRIVEEYAQLTNPGPEPSRREIVF
jgi:hypothetical protein